MVRVSCVASVAHTKLARRGLQSHSPGQSTRVGQKRSIVARQASQLERFDMLGRRFSLCAVFCLESTLGALTRDPYGPLFALIPLETCSLHALIPPVFLPWFSPISGASGGLPNARAHAMADRTSAAG